MKKSIKIIALLSALVLTLTCIGFTVSASDDGVKPKSIRLSTAGETKVMRKGQSFQLKYYITPKDADTDIDVTWESSDDFIVHVDNDGYVTAEEPGEAKITVKTANGKSASVNIVVEGRTEDGKIITFDKSTGTTTDTSDTSKPDTPKTDAAKPAPSKPTTPATNNSSKKRSPLTQEELLKSVSVSGTVTLRNYSTVPVSALNAFAQKSKSKINFDTVNGKSVEGRLTVDTAAAKDLTGELALGIFTSESAVGKVQAAFNKVYSNKVQVIRCEQANFGMPVNIAAKVAKLDTTNIVFYSFDISTGKHTKLDISGAVQDKNGYLQFQTTVGGYLIASEGPLAK